MNSTVVFVVFFQEAFWQTPICFFCCCQDLSSPLRHDVLYVKEQPYFALSDVNILLLISRLTHDS